MTGPFVDIEYNKRKDRRKKRPNGIQKGKNLYEKGQRYKFCLLDGQKFEASVVGQSMYELRVWLANGKIAILPKHSILLAEVVG